MIYDCFLCGPVKNEENMLTVMTTRTLMDHKIIVTRHVTKITFIRQKVGPRSFHW